MSLAEALERAASALTADADVIRPANGDPFQLLDSMDTEAAARLLTWLLANECDDAGDLVEAWAEDDRGVAALAGVDEAALPKAGRKALGRIFHRLRSSGVDLRPRTAEAVVSRLPKIEDVFEAAFVSAVDPSGALLCHLVESGDSGGARLFEVVAHDSKGLERFEVYNSGRGRIRKYLSDIRSSAGTPEVEAELDAVRALITRTAARHPSDRPLPNSFGNWRSHLTPTNEDARTPGEQAREALGEDASPDLLRQAAELVREGVLGPWPPSMDRIVSLSASIREASSGTIVLSEASESERADTALRDAAVELFDAEFAERTTDRFLHSAYVLWKMNDESRARVALSAAAGFRDLPPPENPVALALLEIALGPALKALREEDDSDSEVSV